MDGIGSSELTELLVHVVRAGSRVVAEPDAKVLDLQRLLFRDLECARRFRLGCHDEFVELSQQGWSKPRTLLTATSSPAAFLTFLNFLR